MGKELVREEELKEKAVDTEVTVGPVTVTEVGLTVITAVDVKGVRTVLGVVTLLRAVEVTKRVVTTVTVEASVVREKGDVRVTGADVLII